MSQWDSVYVYVDLTGAYSVGRANEVELKRRPIRPSHGAKRRLRGTQHARGDAADDDGNVPPPRRFRSPVGMQRNKRHSKSAVGKLDALLSTRFADKSEPAHIQS